MEGEASPSKIADETVNLDNTVTAGPADVSVDVEHDKHTDEPSAEQTKAQMKDGRPYAQCSKSKSFETLCSDFEPPLFQQINHFFY